MKKSRVTHHLGRCMWYNSHESLPCGGGYATEMSKISPVRGGKRTIPSTPRSFFSHITQTKMADGGGRTPTNLLIFLLQTYIFFTFITTYGKLYVLGTSTPCSELGASCLECNMSDSCDYGQDTQVECKALDHCQCQVILWNTSHSWWYDYLYHLKLLMIIGWYRLWYLLQHLTMILLCYDTAL